MMKMTKTNLLLSYAAFLTHLIMFGQTNRLTGSPYSLFGLGVETSTNIGKNAALGRGGYALSGLDFINNKNPASFGTNGTNSFIFDVGFLGELSTIQNNTTTENRLASNFSSLAFMANIDKKSRFGLSVAPYSDVGYSLLGIESNIEGSFDQFISNIFGTGALNDFTLNYGRTLFSNFKVGAKVSWLFGSIEETEIVQTGISGLTVEETNSYQGIQAGVGVQAGISKYLGYGLSVNFPTQLSGRQDRTVRKTLDLTESLVESETDIVLEKFELPLEINNGIFINPLSNLYINLDHSIKFWETTGQQDNVGEFINQNIYSAGVEYFIDDNGFKYFQRLKFRLGYYYDTGYLAVRDEDISSQGFSIGFGIPFSRRNRSSINISYTNLNRGSTSGILVDENIHSVNLNITLKDFWFLKRKID